MPGDEEQGVVDAHAEADHAAQLGRPARDVDQVGDERHRADAEGEAEERDPDREAHGDDRSERHEQDDGGGDQADELAGPGLGLLEREEQVAAHLDPQRRTRSGLRAERLEVLQVVRAQLLEHRIADADERDATVGGHRPPTAASVRRAPTGSLVRGAARAPAWTSASAARASADEERRALVARRHDQLGGEPGLIRPGGRQQLGRLLGVDPRRLERVLELPAEGARRGDHEHGHDEPGRRSRPTGGGR